MFYCKKKKKKKRGEPLFTSFCSCMHTLIYLSGPPGYEINLENKQRSSPEPHQNRKSPRQCGHSFNFISLTSGHSFNFIYQKNMKTLQILQNIGFSLYLHFIIVILFSTVMFARALYKCHVVSIHILYTEISSKTVIFHI